MRKIRRILLVLIASGLIISLTMIIPAGAVTSQKDDVKIFDAELVFAETDSAGSIANIQVVDWVSLSGHGTVNVKEEKSFEGSSSFQGVQGFTKPKVEGDQIVWGDLTAHSDVNAIASTQFTEAMVTEAKTRIPLGIHYSYTLDGKKVTPEEITGKSGHFRLELTLTNNSEEKSIVEVKDPNTGELKKTEVTTYLPIVISPYDWYFDNKVFHNLKSDETGLTFFFPDFYQVGWSIPLFPPATERSTKIWVEADVTNFRMPTLTLPVAFLFPETNQIDTLPQFKAGLDQLYGGVKQVDEGIGDPSAENTLLWAMTQIDGALQQMASTSEGVPVAQAAIDTQMIPGVEQMYAGTDTLLWADSQVADGLLSMSMGIGDAASPNTLLNALALTKAGLEEMAAGIGSATTPDTLLYAASQVTGGLGTVKTGAQQISAGLGTTGTANTVIWGLNGIAQNCNPANPAGLYTAVNTVSASMKAGGSFYGLINTTMVFPDPASQALWTGTYRPLINNAFAGSTAALDAARTGIATIYGGLTAPYPTGAIAALQAMKAGADQTIAGIGSASTPNTLLYAMALMTAGLQDMAAGIGSATTANSLLYAVDQITMGLNAMKAGIGGTNVPDSLLYGMAQMQYGLGQLKNALASGDPAAPGIEEGLVELSSGLDTIVAGLGSAETPNTLLNGTSKVSEGLTQMKDGTSLMSEGLMANLVGLNTTEAQLEAIAERGKEFDSFLGRTENAEENQVRFVFQSKPTYAYQDGKSWITALILSLVIMIMLVVGGLLLARRRVV